MLWHITILEGVFLRITRSLENPRKIRNPSCQWIIKLHQVSFSQIRSQTWKTSPKARQLKTKLNSKLLDKRLCAHNLFLIDVLFLPFFFYCIFFQYHTFLKRNNLELVTTIGQKEHWEPTSYQGYWNHKSIFSLWKTLLL